MRPATYSALFSYDRDSRPYFQRANVMDGVQRSKIDRLIKAVKRNANWNDARIYLLRSNQNIGTGSTVYTLGGWSTDNHTLVNGPSWTTSGVDFNGTTQYGIDPNDIWDGGTALTVMADFNQDTLTNAQRIVASFNATGDQRSFQGVATPAGGASYQFYSNSDGTIFNAATSTHGSPATGNQRDIIQIYSPTSLVAYVNGSTSAVTGAPTASLFNSSQPLTLAATAGGGSPFDGTIACLLLFKSTLTDANALAIRDAMIGLR